MEKINIESLFNCKTASTQSKTIDVATIASIPKTSHVGIILKANERKRIFLLNYYRKEYESCIKKIEAANSLGKTDLLFTVTESIRSHPEYDSIECVNYIKEKLEDNYFDTFIADKKQYTLKIVQFLLSE